MDYGHDNPGTLVDVEIAAGVLTVTQTARYPPGSPTLSGVVRELTKSGPVPIAGVKVYRGVVTGWREATTDAAGSYEIRGLFDGMEVIEARMDGYLPFSSQTPINGDTRYDFVLTRR